MKSRGFTLVELVMTLIVIGIIAVTAMSRMDFTSGFSQRAYHDKLKAGLQFARKAAVASRRYVCVAVDPTGVGGKVSFKMENVAPESTAGNCSAGTGLNLPSPDSTSGCAANQICAGSSLSISADNPSFQFDAAGRLTAATKVTFTTAYGFIYVEAETGYVH